MTTEAERIFLERLAAAVPDAAGYRDPAGRRETDALLRRHVASSIESLRDKLAELKAAAGDEGEEDMVDDLDRIDSRMVRTIEALRSVDPDGLAFLDGAAAPEDSLERICSYETALLDDVGLLINDVLGLKYETIGNLTLREVEGTLAAIELKVHNRRDLFASSGRD